jgi:iron complex transport system substrate-binding protein
LRIGANRRGRLALLAAILLVPVPAWAAPAQRIADLWYAHNAMLVMLGAADRVAVTVATPKAQPWMFRIAPRLLKARQVANGPANVEALMADHIDLAFVSQAAEADRLSRLGVPTRKVDFTDVPTMRASIRTSAAAIGTPQAASRGHAYEAYLDTTLAQLRSGLAGLAGTQRPRVLHLVSLSPLRADGADTLIDTWIKLAGGRSAAEGLSGNQQPISPEQIIRWNPDIIIVGGQAAGPTDRPWEAMPIFRGRRVVRNPMGVFPWDRYGPEFALQLQWAAKLFQPARFVGLDLRARTIAFYRRFFDHTLTTDEYRRILNALPPSAAP